MICRLFGTAEDLRCDHGCRPEVLLSSEAAHALVAEYNALATNSGELSFAVTVPYFDNIFAGFAKKKESTAK
jgi:hypothetical protein